MVKYKAPNWPAITCPVCGRGGHILVNPEASEEVNDIARAMSFTAPDDEAFSCPYCAHPEIEVKPLEMDDVEKYFMIIAVILLIIAFIVLVFAE